MVNRMDMESILPRVMRGLKEIGRMIFNKVRESKLGLMAPNMKVITKMVKRLDKANTRGLMDHSIKENG